MHVKQIWKQYIKIVSSSLSDYTGTLRLLYDTKYRLLYIPLYMFLILWNKLDKLLKQGKLNYK